MSDGEDGRGSHTHQYMMALAAPLLSSSSLLHELVSNTLINVPCEHEGASWTSVYMKEEELHGLVYTGCESVEPADQSN